jgi:succinate dehydrogenase / fumarate reductase cytochrome b subunit
MSDRPKYLNLMQIRLPVPGWVSILHRVSGAALFLALPVLLYWLQQSFRSADAFELLRSTFSHGFVKLVLIGLLWGYFHHLAAGIRHLALDLDIGTELPAARASAWLVILAGVVLTVIAGVLIW